MTRLEGTLSKWTNVMKGWQYRWFVLDENAGLLSYYTSKEKMMKGVRRGCVRLKGALIGIDDQDVNTFTITVDHKTFHFQAMDAEEREKWVRPLEDTILKHAYRTREIWDQQTSVYGTTNATTKRNYLQTLDKRVTEADAFLQLMIDQTNKVETKIGSITDPAECEKNKNIKECANAMLESIKHSIVLIQIAKNTAHPINGIYNGPSGSSSNEKTSVDDKIGNSIEDNSPVVGIPNQASQGIESKLKMPPNIDAALSLFVPETSYSSSEGEDDFYDANDDTFSSQTASPTGNVRSIVETFPKQEPIPSESTSNTRTANDPKSIQEESTKGTKKDTFLPYRSDGSLDYDLLYEDESEMDLSMEYGNVVTHLLSQVKIGMDLTKVVLPTFILERRSLLEMYADYFAHPDLFIKIADLADPRDRIIQVVRWYLSSYHAGRKSVVAKKPYNPILGEIFQCHWDIPLDQSNNNSTVEDGPVPWCNKDQLTFIAEQVSHHPPISAFYAEHVSKKICFAAHVWTKSKFLGLSIGVHNIGQGIVTLCDRNEEYILTFPNGYGRSILTVPWVELGGSVTIQCPKTGYHADIEFLTKPFYGGKRNRITAEIYAPNEKKSFLSVNGEWSGLMEYKINDGMKQKSEVFVDVNSIPIYKKIVRPIAEQTDNESRKIWMEVTAGLRLNDIERATNAKSQIEQTQRDSAKERKDNGKDWDTKYFKSVGESWMYANSLSERINTEQKISKR